MCDQAIDDLSPAPEAGAGGEHGLGHHGDTGVQVVEGEDLEVDVLGEEPPVESDGTGPKSLKAPLLQLRRTSMPTWPPTFPTKRGAT